MLKRDKNEVLLSGGKTVWAPIEEFMVALLKMDMIKERLEMWITILSFDEDC